MVLHSYFASDQIGQKTISRYFPFNLRMDLQNCTVKLSIHSSRIYFAVSYQSSPSGSPDPPYQWSLLHCKQFSIYVHQYSIPKIDLAKPQFIYQQNISKTELQCSVWSHSAASIRNNIVPNRIMKFQQQRRFIFPDQNHKDGPLKLLFPFLKYTFGIWH